MNQALLSFSIGPVQDFIAAARTLRDLWTGSYLLSWLTSHAMNAVRNEFQTAEDRFLFPDAEGNPLLQAVVGQPPSGQRLLLACVPQTFVAQVSGDPKTIQDRCCQAVQSEWRRISDKVHAVLAVRWNPVCPG
jgi:CRISPR-associated protein Cmr2